MKNSTARKSIADEIRRCRYSAAMAKMQNLPSVRFGWHMRAWGISWANKQLTTQKPDETR